MKKNDVAATQIAWLGERQSLRHDKHFESLDLSNREVKPTVSSIESPPILELKLLPSYLKYVFLGKNNTLHVIISSSLNSNKEMSLVNVLGKYKKAIGWTIANIKGINPSIYMHKILLDDCHINSIEQ